MEEVILDTSVDYASYQLSLRLILSALYPYKLYSRRNRMGLNAIGAQVTYTTTSRPTARELVKFLQEGAMVR